MGIDLKKWNDSHKRYEERRPGGQLKQNLLKPDVGYTLLYVVPPTDDMEGLPFVEALAHSRIGGPNGKFGLCLESDNPVADHPSLTAVLDEFDKEIAWGEGLCPVDACLAGDEAYATLAFEELDLKEMLPKPIYLFRAAVFATWAANGQPPALPATDEEWAAVRLGLYMAPPTVWEGIRELVSSEGDITDPDRAQLVKVLKTVKGAGKGKRGRTEYTVSVDTRTVKSPLRLTKAFKRRILDGEQSKGDLDLWRYLANIARPVHELEAFLRGEEVRRTDEGGAKVDPNDPASIKACYGQAAEIDPSDPECRGCRFKVGCAGIIGCAVPPDIGAETARTPAAASASPDKGNGDPAPAGRPRGRPPKVRAVTSVSEERSSLPKPATAEPETPFDDAEVEFTDEEVVAAAKPPEPAARSATPAAATGGKPVDDLMAKFRAKRAALLAGKAPEAAK